MKTVDAWLQIGLNKRDQLIHISESPRGDACGLVCPYCYEDLTAKKGRVKIYHFAHQANSCHPYVPSFDFWATQNITTGLQLDQFAHQHQEHLCSERTSLQQLQADKTQAWQETKNRMPELLGILTNVSKSFKNGERPHNRQVNYEVLQDVQEFIESPSSERGPIPSLYKIRHSSFDSYWGMWFERGLWGAKKHSGQLVYPSQVWQFELERGSFVIPAILRPHYDALVHYHQCYNEYADATKELEAFERTLVRFQSFSFYFLQIDLPTGRLYKSGVTSRPLVERLVEIQRDLRHLAVVSIKPLAVVEQAGYLESYFKRKYNWFRKLLSSPAGPLTEYFDLPTWEAESIIDSLQKLVKIELKTLVASTRAERIRAGMRRVQQTGSPIGRPKIAEKADAFLKKSKSKTISQLLSVGHSLREIERQTGYSINTIRKVNQLLTQQNSVS